MGDPAKHARLSPSDSARWMNCPGSIALSEKCPPEPESPYARLGSIAHELAAVCLKEWEDAHTYETITYEDAAEEVTAEMAEAVQVYLNHARTLVSEEEIMTGEKEMFVEVRFNLNWLVQDVFGTSDLVIADYPNRTLHVCDYKHGEGEDVEIEGNTQLRIYALGALLDLTVKKEKKSMLDLFDWIEMTIVQPRIYTTDRHIKTERISSAELRLWAHDVLTPAAKRTREEGAPLNPGAKQCRWCTAKAICPGQLRHAQEVAQSEFTPEGQLVLPMADQLTPAQIVRVMDASKLFEDWAKSVRQYAQQQLEAGVQLPGYKLVNKKSNRAWVDPIAAEEKFTKILGENAITKQLKSPAQIEDALKKAGYKPKGRAAVLEGQVCKPPAGVTMAPVTDKRPAVPGPALMDFLDDADFLK